MRAQDVVAKFLFVLFFFFEVALLERIQLSQCVLAEGNSLMELAVVFYSMIIVPVVVLLHYDSVSMSVSSATTSPLLLLSSSGATVVFFRPFLHWEILQSEIWRDDKHETNNKQIVLLILVSILLIYWCIYGQCLDSFNAMLKFLLTKLVVDVIVVKLSSSQHQ